MFINRQERVKPLHLNGINLVLVYPEKRVSAQHWKKMNSSASCEKQILDSNSTQAPPATLILIITNIITASVTSLLNGLVIIKKVFPVKKLIVLVY